MKTKKEISKAVNEYRKELFIKSAKLSGRAIKVITAENNGIYPVLSTLTGTGIVTRILLSVALKSVKKSITDKVSASEIVSAYNALEENNFSSSIGKLYNEEIKRTGKPYGNYKTLKNRLISEINSGSILGFTFKNTDDPETINLFGKVKI